MMAISSKSDTFLCQRGNHLKPRGNWEFIIISRMSDETELKFASRSSTERAEKKKLAPYDTTKVDDTCSTMNDVSPPPPCFLRHKCDNDSRQQVPFQPLPVFWGWPGASRFPSSQVGILSLVWSSSSSSLMLLMMMSFLIYIHKIAPHRLGTRGKAEWGFLGEYLINVLIQIYGTDHSSILQNISQHYEMLCI